MVEFVNGTIYWSSATNANIVWRDPIGQFYRAGSMWQGLGLPTAGEQAVAGVADGRVQQVQRGRIYYSPATGAHEIYGGILATYLALGAQNSGLGLPITGETAGLLPGTRMSSFLNGTLYWTGSAGFAVIGPFDDVYRQPSLTPVLGNPTSAATAAALGLAAGDAVTVTQPEGGRASLVVAIDDRVAAGAVRIAGASSSTAGLSSLFGPVELAKDAEGQG